MICLTDCPPNLRGDLSKWLCEINAGVYVGNVSGRVRDELWSRVCDHLKYGRASMVYSANGDQKMAFRVHNANWLPVDFDGITLMKRPLPGAAPAQEGLKAGFSKAAKGQMARRRAVGGSHADRIVLIDVETTGLDPRQDQIIEYGAVRAENFQPVETFCRLVRIEGKLPAGIVSLTGITDSMLQESGVPPEQALREFLSFIGQERLAGYHIGFDMDFIQAACSVYHEPVPSNRCMDLLGLAKRRVYGVPNYKLETLLRHFSLSDQPVHRAEADCVLELQLYEKLKE